MMEEDGEVYTTGQIRTLGGDNGNNEQIPATSAFDSEDVNKQYIESSVNDAGTETYYTMPKKVKSKRKGTKGVTKGRRSSAPDESTSEVFLGDKEVDLKRKSANDLSKRRRNSDHPSTPNKMLEEEDTTRGSLDDELLFNSEIRDVMEVATSADFKSNNFNDNSNSGGGPNKSAYQMVILHLKQRALTAEERLVEKDNAMDTLRSVVDQQNERLCRQQEQIEHYKAQVKDLQDELLQQSRDAANVTSSSHYTRSKSLSPSRTLSMRDGEDVKGRVQKLRDRMNQNENVLRKQRAVRSSSEDVAQQSASTINEPIFPDLDNGDKSRSVSSMLNDAEETISAKDEQLEALRQQLQDERLRCERLELKLQKLQKKQDTPAQKKSPIRSTPPSPGSHKQPIRSILKHSSSSHSSLAISSNSDPLTMSASSDLLKTSATNDTMTKSSSDVMTPSISGDLSDVTTQDIDANLTEQEKSLPVWVKRKIITLQNSMKVKDAALQDAFLKLNDIYVELKYLKNSPKLPVRPIREQSTVSTIGETGDDDPKLDSPIAEDKNFTSEESLAIMENDLELKTSLLEKAQQKEKDREAKIKELKQTIRTIRKESREMERTACACIEVCQVNNLEEVLGALCEMQHKLSTEKVSTNEDHISEKVNDCLKQCQVESIEEIPVKVNRLVAEIEDLKLQRENQNQTSSINLIDAEAVAECVKQCEVASLDEIFPKLNGLIMSLKEKDALLQRSESELNELRAETLTVLQHAKVFVSESEKDMEQEIQRSDELLQELQESLRHSISRHKQLDQKIQDLKAVCNCTKLNEIPRKMYELQIQLCNTIDENEKYSAIIQELETKCQVKTIEELLAKVSQLQSQIDYLQKKEGGHPSSDMKQNLKRQITSNNKTRGVQGTTINEDVEFDENSMELKKCDSQTVDEIFEKIKYLEDELTVTQGKLSESQNDLAFLRVQTLTEQDNTAEIIQSAVSEVVATKNTLQANKISHKKPISLSEMLNTQQSHVSGPASVFSEMDESTREHEMEIENLLLKSKILQQSQVSERIVTLEAQISQKEIQIASLEDNLKTLHGSAERVNELEASLESIQKALSRANDDHLALEGTISSIQTVCLTNHIPHVPEALAELRRQVVQARNRLTSSEEAKGSLTVGEELKLYANNALTKRIEDLDVELSKTKEELKLAQQHIKDLEQRQSPSSTIIISDQGDENATPSVNVVTSLKAELARAEQRARLLQSEVNQLRKNVESADSNSDGTSIHDSTLKKTSNPKLTTTSNDGSSVDYQLELHKLQRLVQQKEREISELNSEMQYQSSELTNSKNTIETLEEDRAYNQAKLHELETLMQSTLKDDIEIRLKEKSMECVKVTVERNILVRKLQEAEVISKALRIDVEQQKDIIRKLGNIEGDGSSLNDVIRSLQSEHQRGVSKVADLSIRLAESRGRVDELSQEVRRLKAELREAQDQKSIAGATRQAAESMIRTVVRKASGDWGDLSKVVRRYPEANMDPEAAVTSGQARQPSLLNRRDASLQQSGSASPKPARRQPPQRQRSMDLDCIPVRGVTRQNSTDDGILRLSSQNRDSERVSTDGSTTTPVSPKRRILRSKSVDMDSPPPTYTRSLLGKSPIRGLSRSKSIDLDNPPSTGTRDLSQNRRLLLEDRKDPESSPTYTRNRLGQRRIADVHESRTDSDRLKSHVPNKDIDHSEHSEDSFASYNPFENH